MNHISALKVGCGKFFHGKNVLCLLPDEIRRLGGKALVIGGKNSMKAFLDQPMIGDLLISPDIECQMIEFSGECTVARAKQYADTALKEKATVLVGIGGESVLTQLNAVLFFLRFPSLLYRPQSQPVSPLP